MDYQRRRSRSPKPARLDAIDVVAPPRPMWTRSPRRCRRSSAPASRESPGAFGAEAKAVATRSSGARVLAALVVDRHSWAMFLLYNASR